MRGGHLLLATEAGDHDLGAAQTCLAHESRIDRPDETELDNLEAHGPALSLIET